LRGKTNKERKESEKGVRKSGQNYFPIAARGKIQQERLRTFLSGRESSPTHVHPPKQPTAESGLLNADRSFSGWPERNLELAQHICILSHTTARGKNKACATSPAIVCPFVRSRHAPAPATPHPYAGVRMVAAQIQPSVALPFFGRALEFEPAQTRSPHTPCAVAKVAGTLRVPSANGSESGP
jgi:hypothetical protein